MGGDTVYTLRKGKSCSRAIWLCQSCNKCLSTNHKVLDSVYLLFHCSCTQVLQYIALSIAALGRMCSLSVQVKTIQYQKPSLCSSQTQRNVSTYCSGWLWFCHPIFQISSPQDWAAWASVAIVSGGLGMRTFYCIHDKLYSTHTGNSELDSMYYLASHEHQCK